MDVSISLSGAMDSEGCQIELRLLPGRLVLQKALSPLLILSKAVGTAICQPNGISLQVYPEEQNDVFPILAATLRINPASVDYFRCSEPITAGFKPNFLNNLLFPVADEGITVTADYQRMEVAFSLGRLVAKTRTLGTDIPNNIMEIDDSEFVYAVMVGIAAEDFRRIIRHFRHLSPFVEAFVTDEEVTWFGGNCAQYREWELLYWGHKWIPPGQDPTQSAQPGLAT